MRARCFFVLVSVVATLQVSAAVAQAEGPRFTGPWDLKSLKETPESRWGTKSGSVTEVFYAGERFGGKPTRVFAYYARPTAGNGPFPAMLLVHGGGGKAFREWATLWADRGYCALAMDLAGHGSDGARLPDGGPDQNDDGKFRDFSDTEVREMWTYHAVAAVLRGHSLLAAQPEVDRRRIGVTGISWGGYLTCIVAGIDDRLKVAVPVYGCGFLDEDSAWLPRFAKMTESQRNRWVARLDPSRYLPGVRCPILFVNGTNDFAYPLDSYQKSYKLVPGPVDLCVTVGMPHGHPQGWAPKEIGLFVDSVLRAEKPLARIEACTLENGRVTARVHSSVPLVKAQIHTTSDTGAWQKRQWRSDGATVDHDRINGTLPQPRPTVFFLTVTDARGAVTSSPHLELTGR